MAEVSIIVSDVDLNESTYKVAFNVSDKAIEDGKVTAACFSAFYLQSLIEAPSFREAAKTYGDNLKEVLDADGPRLNTTETARVIIRLEDIDIRRGSYRIHVEGEGGDPTHESLPTPAQIVGGYTATLLHDLNFRQSCIAFAEAYVQKNAGASIANRDELPITLSLNDDDAATLAA